jgi:hypothetical protein
MIKSVIINGPPCSGKDCLFDYFVENLPYTGYNHLWVEHRSFAKPLKQILQIQYNLTDEEIAEYDSNHVLKETPEERFGGKSWRTLCKELSNEMKIKFGEEYFGNHLVKRIEQISCPWEIMPLNVVITDGGFAEETYPLIRKFGADNVIAIKLIRPGFDYSKDSRKYLDYETLGIKHHILENNGTLDEYLKKGSKLLFDILLS